MEEFCKAHFEEYHSTSSFGCNVTQLSTGILETQTTCSPIQDVHLEIFKSNQTLLYEEEANTKSVSFCWLDSLEPNNKEALTTISGHQMTRNSVAGFNRINKTGGNIWDIVGPSGARLAAGLPKLAEAQLPVARQTPKAEVAMARQTQGNRLPAKSIHWFLAQATAAPAKWTIDLCQTHGSLSCLLFVRLAPHMNARSCACWMLDSNVALFARPAF